MRRAFIECVQHGKPERGHAKIIGVKFRHPRVVKGVEGVLRNGFDKTATEFAIEFPPPEEAVGIDHWVSLFEIYTPARGEEGIGMKEIHSKLVERSGGEGCFMPED